MTKVTDELKQLIINLANEGSSKTKIAEKTGVSKSSIYRVLEDENIDIQIEDSQDDQLGDKITEAIVGEGWDVSEEIPQLIFNLKRIAKKSQTSLLEMMEEIEDSLDFCLSRSKMPIKVYDRMVDFVNFLKEKDVYELFESLEGLIKKGYYLSEVEHKIELCEKIIEKNEDKIYKLNQEIVGLNDGKSVIMANLLNNANQQKQNETILKYQTLFEESIKKIKEVELENVALRETMKAIGDFFIGHPDLKALLEQFEEQQFIENQVEKN